MPLPRREPVQPEPGGKELQRAAELIDTAENPIALVGSGAIRANASRALRAFAQTSGIPVAETFMAKGLIDSEDPHSLGTVGLEWSLLGLGDLNGDGRSDMVFRRVSDGMLSAYLMNGFQMLGAELLGGTAF